MPVTVGAQSEVFVSCNPEKRRRFSHRRTVRLGWTVAVSLGKESKERRINGNSLFNELDRDCSASSRRFDMLL
ncbi:hypothetical protein [Candidatus Binatus soli]|jgi:hypothetical protein|uniref:hypothetical protein n=1 Tax=Candidatus Binatus soli TaxID=1953413 RepID=UPI003D13DD6F